MKGGVVLEGVVVARGGGSDGGGGRMTSLHKWGACAGAYLFEQLALFVVGAHHPLLGDHVGTHSAQDQTNNNPSKC